MDKTSFPVAFKKNKKFLARKGVRTKNLEELVAWVCGSVQSNIGNLRFRKNAFLRLKVYCRKFLEKVVTTLYELNPEGKRATSMTLEIVLKKLGIERTSILT